VLIHSDGSRAATTAMSSRGARQQGDATGLITILLAVSAGVNFSGGGGSGLLLSFAGVLAGANIIAGGVRMAEDPAPPPSAPGCSPVRVRSRDATTSPCWG